MSDDTREGRCCQAFGPIEQAPGLRQLLEYVESHLREFGEALPPRFEMRLRVDTNKSNFAWQIPLDLDCDHEGFTP